LLSTEGVDARIRGHDCEKANRGPSMTVYMVFEPPRAGGDPVRRAERMRFVRDRFTWSAFLFAPLWMLRHRLWLALVGYVVAVPAVMPALWLAGGRAGSLLLALAMIHLLVGIEAATFRRRSLSRRGWRDLGIVIGDDLEAAERRFFDAYAARAGARGEPVAPVPPAPPPPLRPGPAGDVVGLFPQPGASPGAGR
jgi:hypothetical protein